MSDTQTARGGRGLDLNTKLFVTLVASIGSVVVGTAAVSLGTSEYRAEWAWVAALTLVSGYFTIKLPGIPSTISVSETFVIASVLLFGRDAGTMTVLLDALVITLRFRKRHDPWQVAFNLSAGPISIWTGATVFSLLSTHPESLSDRELSTLLLPLLALTICYFLVNSSLVAIALGLERKRPPTAIWSSHLRWLSVNYFGGASLAALLVAYTKTVDVTAVGLILPLLLISYLTSRTSLARIEDAHRHVSEIRSLYLDTIQSLAVAVDAKDQITHGHIRRVQHLALLLARHLGVRSEGALEALQAAALLHDIGKIAIPEFILNKPGKLDPSEFEVMKTHAAKGAEMLSAIRFPYPVAPIVRSHHENWNGTGYPDGLVGADIPLGARILSVVDCFDALTSHRPYRPALPASEAMQVLLSRRGSMYDPMVVDAFVELLPSLNNDSILVSSATEIGPSQSEADAAVRRDSTSDKDLGEVTSHSACEELSLLIHDFIPHDGVALYRVRRQDSCVELIGTSGSIPRHLAGTRVALGEQVSGWVAANSATALNSPYSLEFPDSADHEHELIMTAVTQGPSVEGVIGLSSRKGQPFSSQHADLLKMIASSRHVVSPLGVGA